ncbi:tetratricopeptide repeat protein [Palleronia aestuarii]|uniref:Tetratricopeptide repeat protein n=1 Tax=Palleronia aestuarii TaxID=568105 RepID=A0A2W7N9B0_9RHOB|nr:tetratricopeptide repeat protein [Palleronia aestuarii]PZX16620.1 tetratricopeptide repeat protein [Palleronia aestuarii]
MLRPVLLAALLGLTSVPATAQTNSGPYLAGRHAQISGDFAEAARYLGEAIREDGQNLGLLDALAGSYVSLGQVDRAEAVARRAIETGGQSQIASLVLIASQAKDDRWAPLLEDLDAGMSVGPLFDGLVRAWALLGDGQDDAAIEAFDAVAKEQGVALFGIYHKALALASIGRFEEAETTLSDASSLRLARRGVLAQVEILSQLGRFDEAMAMLESGFGDELDPPLMDIRNRLEAEEAIEFDITPTARDGIAEAFHDIASVLISETGPEYTLVYTRLAEYLRPDLIEATLMSAQLLENLGQHDLAIEAFGAIPDDSPAFEAAELGRAQVMREAGRDDAAIEVMRQLARQRPDSAAIRMALGDTLRQLERFDEARRAYDAAIELSSEDGEVWLPFFSRAVTEERLGDWNAAEADFRKALEINPEQPQVLNYLGYSLVERQENLDEALDMIERAAAAEPESGYIIDSLGWVLYRLGRYDEAVDPMERAVELMPVDPVVNDHLGDVYWAVGRELEARFQWMRALSFVENDQNDEVKPDRIRKKLDVGLDEVLAEEGADPLRVADDG